MGLSGKKIYFVSDAHLGAPDYTSSLQREKLLVQWLDTIKKDAAELYIVGDLFDFWFEYGQVIPKGYTRILGKLAELSDSGLPMHFFIGNHDMWMSGYFEKELNIPVHHHPIMKEWNGKKFYIGHGDGLGPGDYGYKFIKKVFRNPLCQWLFKWIHPDIGMGIANFWSKRSRIANETSPEKFLGEEKEWLVTYAKEQLQKEYFDYFVFGHRHLPLDIDLGQGSRYINLGDWITHFSYAEFDGNHLALKYYKAAL